MKKMSISQIPSAEILSAEEMKMLLGGIQSGGTGCESLSKGSCAGSCTIHEDGKDISGTCGWGSVSNACRCYGATVDF